MNLITVYAFQLFLNIYQPIVNVLNYKLQLYLQVYEHINYEGKTREVLYPIIGEKALDQCQELPPSEMKKQALSLRSFSSIFKIEFHAEDDCSDKVAIVLGPGDRVNNLAAHNLQDVLTSYKVQLF